MKELAVVIVVKCQEKYIGKNFMRLLSACKRGIDIVDDESPKLQAAAASSYGAPEGAESLSVGLYYDDPTEAEHPCWAVEWCRGVTPALHGILSSIAKEERHGHIWILHTPLQRLFAKKGEYQCLEDWWHYCQQHNRLLNSINDNCSRYGRFTWYIPSKTKSSLFVPLVTDQQLQTRSCFSHLIPDAIRLPMTYGYTTPSTSITTRTCLLRRTRNGETTHLLGGSDPRGKSNWNWS